VSWQPPTIVYHRQNEHYREAHALSRAILDGAGPRSLLREGSRRSFAFFIDMNRLFERFVERYVSELLAPAGVRVEGQAESGAVLHDVAAGKSHSKVRPDLVARSRDGRVRLALDVKYKDITTRGVDPGDLYQAFLYATAWSPAAMLPRSLLIFPIENERPVQWIEVRNLDRGALGRLGLLGVSVARVLGMRAVEKVVLDAELRAAVGVRVGEIGELEIA
jgi:5-methylcytosine-specific restriction enzyme subunit McrC